jgi:SAM-dependent MidA family methyltransferase
MAREARDEFERTTENVRLVELLRARIQAEGPVTFRDYMETVLYHPQEGYYTSREGIGREGDYLTSPEVHPAFGALAGKQIAQMWDLLGRPETFDLVEQGAGSGRLAGDLLRWARRRHPEFARALRYRIVEISPALRRRQQEALADSEARVDWLDALPETIEGCLLSNELLDSFPVHRVVNHDGELRETYVSYRDGQFEEQAGPLSTDAIEAYFARLGLRPRPGCLAEVNLRAVEWMRGAARALRRGYVLTFDYGYPAEELYAPWRREGTLLCFYRHNPSTDPYARIGKQDMTSHVDFSALIRAGEEEGLQVAGFTTQSRFLANLGIGEAVEHVAREEPQALEEYYARRRAVQELIDPAGLGRIRVLAQRKGAPTGQLAGFVGDSDA